MEDEKGFSKDHLPANWFFKGQLDEEYKHYILLAYLKRLDESFKKNQLYPYLSDLIHHYQNLKNFMDKKNDLVKEFPKELTGMDLKKLKLYYQKLIEDDDLMKRLENIVKNSIETMEPYLAEGKEVYEFVEDNLDFKQIGLASLNPDSGYLFIRNGDQGFTQVYFYKAKSFRTSKDQFKGITTKYLASFKRNLTNTYEALKKEMVKNYKRFSAPGGYAVESAFNLPEKETLLPIAKRLLIRNLDFS